MMPIIARVVTALPQTTIDSGSSGIISSTLDLRNLVGHFMVLGRFLNTVSSGNATVTYQGSADGVNWFDITTTTGISGTGYWYKNWSLSRISTTDLVPPFVRLRTILASGTSVDVELICWYQEYGDGLVVA